MSGHTPGPWTFGKDADGNAVVSTMPKPSDILPGASEWWFIATVMGTPGNRDKKANARLMAAAPDLLAALEAATEAYVYHYGEDCPLAVQCRAAIAKAKGEI